MPVQDIVIEKLNLTCIFSAQQALGMSNPMFKVKPISQATKATKLKTKRCAGQYINFNAKYNIFIIYMYNQAYWYVVSRLYH